ncbi:MAG: HAD-IC family P-type ATPase, partial [Thermodesulfovibrionales bacterium]|nr:HAD-IC family P-type ATPase [Thermodesulfovibrionales bacterium]
IVVTITMAIGLNRMARRNAIIRKLTAVETLGSTTVIGSDKTGTLTKNEMTVQAIFDGKYVYRVTGTGYNPKGEILHDSQPINIKANRHLLMALRIGLLCNESRVYQENEEYKVEGDPTEGALIVSAMKAGLIPEEERKHYPLLAIIPFESERGYMATLHSHGHKKLIFIKGAPEKLLEMCTRCAISSEPRTAEILNQAHLFAEEGMRVLAMAYKEASHDVTEITHHDVEGDLIFAGIQAMIDPPRPEAIEAISKCKEAGIRVIMITGDHAATAQAIAKMLGISGDGGKVLTGKEIERMSNEELFHKIKDVSVFARVSPEHKLRITQQLIRHGNIVAITGDGVNDAPALKAAHIGVAMGKSGTDVAKEASDMVIVDDNFATIVNAVEEGRVVFDNIRKVTFFLIPTGFAAVISILITMIMGLPIPYVPAQLLWINLVTNGLQDVALAFEPREKGILKRPPRSPKEGIMSKLMLQRSAMVGMLISIGVVYTFIDALESGVSLEKARTIAVTTMVFFQFFHAWNSRSEFISIFRISPMSNPFLFYTMIAAFFAQLAFIYVPALQWVFRTEPITLSEWVNIILISLTVIFVVEIDKYLRHRIRVRKH